jgi:allantoin racemase
MKLMEMKILMLGSSHTGEHNRARRKEACQKIANPGTEVVSMNVETLPDLVIPSIKCFVDEYLCAGQVIKTVAKEHSNFDGIVLSGFSDVGLDAAREIAEIPVLGMAETSFLIAALLANKFSVLTSTKKWMHPKERRLKALGLDSRVASLRPFPVFKNDEERVNLSAELVKKCVEEDDAETVILGGGPFCGWGQAISKKAGNICPVIDPATTAFKVMEALLILGLGHSKAGMWEKLIPSMLGTRKYIRPFET